MNYGIAIYLSAALGSMVLGCAAAAQDEAAVREAAKRDMEANMAALAAEADNQADDDESETVKALAEFEADLEAAMSDLMDEGDFYDGDGASSRNGVVYPLGITAADYPLEAWRDGSEGTVRFELDHDAAGTIVDCRITESSGSAVLDDATCPIILKRAKADLFEYDDPTSGTMKGSYRWKREEPDVGNFKMVIAYTVGVDGNTKSCEVILAEGDLPEEFGDPTAFEQECSISKRGVPYRNSEGEPIEKRLMVTISAQDIPLETE